MSETAVKKCCGTCKFWSQSGIRQMSNPPRAFCGYPLPQWVHIVTATLASNYAPSMISKDAGENCPCYEPKPTEDATDGE